MGATGCQDAHQSARQSAQHLIVSLPAAASPSTAQLEALLQAFVQACEDARAAAAKSAAAKGSGMDIKLLAKEAGPLAMGVVKALSSKQDGANRQQALLMGTLCVHALDLLDTVRSVLTTKGLELEVQRYNLIRRMTLAGHTQLAIQQGARLHDALDAHASAAGPASSSSLEELSLACRLNLVVSVGEALANARSSLDAQLLLEQAMPPVSALLVQLRSTSSAEATKHAESVFKYLYKFQTSLAGFKDTSTSHLQAQLLQAFCQAAELVQQTSKLSKYTAKMASDLRSEGSVHFLFGILRFIEQGAAPMVSGVRCLDETIKALASRGVSVTPCVDNTALWQAAAAHNPAVGFVCAAACTTCTPAKAPARSRGFGNDMMPSKALDDLLAGALKEAHQVAESLHKQGSSSSSSSSSNGGVHARLGEVWSALCSLQHVLLERLSPGRLEWEGSMLAVAAEAMQVHVSLAAQLAQEAKAWAQLPPFQGTPDATITQPGLMAALTACKLQVTAAGSVACTGAPDQSSDPEEALASTLDGLAGLLQHASAAGALATEDAAWAMAHIASLGNDLMRTEQWRWAALLLQAAINVGAHWLSCAGAQPCTKTLLHLGKVCCAHATALGQQEGMEGTVAAAAVQHITLLTQGGWDASARAVISLLRQHVRARHRSLQQQQQSEHSSKQRAASSVRPSKTAQASRTRAASGPAAAAAAAAARPQGAAALASTAAGHCYPAATADLLASSLQCSATQSLAHAWAGGGGGGGGGCAHLGEVLDLCAYEEAGLMAAAEEEGSTAAEGAAFAAEPGTLAGCLLSAFDPVAQPHLHARALLAAALLGAPPDAVQAALAPAPPNPKSRTTSRQQTATISNNPDQQDQLLHIAQALLPPTTTTTPAHSSTGSKGRSASTSVPSHPHQVLVNAHTCSALCCTLRALDAAGRAVEAGSSSNSSSSIQNTAGDTPGAAEHGSSDSGSGGERHTMRAWDASCSAWQCFEEAAGEALSLWEQFVQLLESLADSGVQPLPQIQLQPQLSLQLLTQIWQITAVQDHEAMASRVQHVLHTLCHLGVVRPGSQVAGAWALLQPGVGSACSALGPSLCLQSAAEVLGCAERAGPQIQEVLQQLEALRSSASPLRPPSTDTKVLEQCVLTAAACPPPGRGQLWLLLRAQLHQHLAAAHMRAGATVQAYVHVQEALKLSGAVFRCLAGQLQPSTPQQDQQQPPNAQQHGAGLLTWAAASAYLAALLQGARVFEACSCVEDAHSLLRECAKLAGMLRSPGAAALAALQNVHITIRGQGGQQQPQQEQQEDQGAVQSLQLAAHCLSMLPASNPARALIAALSLEAEGDVKRLREHAHGQALQLYAQGLALLEEASSTQGTDDQNDQITKNMGGSSSSSKGVGGLPPKGGRSRAGKDTCEQGVVGREGEQGPVLHQDQDHTALQWHARALQCKLHLRCAVCVLSGGAHRHMRGQQCSESDLTAEQHADAAAGAIEAHSTEHQQSGDADTANTANTPWPVQSACVLLLRAQCACAACSVRDAGVSWSCDDDDADQQQRPPAVVGVCQQQGRHGGLQEQFSKAKDSPTHTQQHSAGRGKAASTKARGSTGVSGAESPAQRLDAELGSLLQALLLCWQVPKLASRTCKALLHCAWRAHLPHAAAMFLHLQLGMGATQQAAAAAAARASPWAAPPANTQTHPSPTTSTTTTQGSSGRSSSAAATHGHGEGHLITSLDQGGSDQEGHSHSCGAEGSSSSGADSAAHLLHAAHAAVCMMLAHMRGLVDQTQSGSVPQNVSKSRGSRSRAQHQDGPAQNSAQQDGLAGCGGGNKRLEGGVEAIAAQWLDCMLSTLPEGCAVATLTTMPCAAEGQPGGADHSMSEGDSDASVGSSGQGAQPECLMLGRVERGSVPLVLALPPPPLSALPDWWQHADTAAACYFNEGGHSSSTRAQPAQQQRQQPKRAPARTSSRAQAHATVPQQEGGDGCVQGSSRGQQDERDLGHVRAGGGVGVLLGLVQQLLEESHRSMHGLGPVDTAVQKAQWWKARVHLDERMAELLAHMQASWLGPWRVLLSHVPPAKRALLKQPAAALAQEHFGPLSQDTDSPATAAVVTELVLLLLAHWPPSPCTTSSSTSRLASSGADNQGEAGTAAFGSNNSGSSDAALSRTEQCTCIQQLCLATQQRADLAHASGIAQAFAEAAASVGAAESEAAEGTTCGRFDSTLQPRACSTQGQAGNTGRQHAAGGLGFRAKGAGSTDLGLGSDLEAPEIARREVSHVSGEGVAVSSYECTSTAAAAAGGSGAGSKSGMGARKRGGSRLTGMQQQQQQEGPAAVSGSSGRPTRGSRARAVATAPPPAVAETECEEGDSEEPASATQTLPAAAPSAHTTGARAPAQAGVPSSACTGSSGSSEGSLLLAMQPALHALPWESMQCLRAARTQVYRVPCLQVAAACCARMRAVTHAAVLQRGDAEGSSAGSIHSRGGGGVGGNGSASSSTYSSSSGGAGARRGGSRGRVARDQVGAELESAPQEQEEGNCGGDTEAGIASSSSSSGSKAEGGCADLASTYFVLNPGGDLVDTQAAFQAWFADQLGWEGVTGTPPAPKELTAALQSHAMFVYFGHGSGEQYLPLASLRRLHDCASSLLMGCSSGRLRLHGQYDPAGMVWALLLAGCPAVVANLWDVTDRDIDRFSQALLKTWLGEDVGEGAAGITGAESCLSRSSSSTGAGCSSHSNSSSRGRKGRAVGQAAGQDGRSRAVPSRGAYAQQRAAVCSSVAASVGTSRSACRLPHLIGAAPVCYGVPLEVVWRQ